VNIYPFVKKGLTNGSVYASNLPNLLKGVAMTRKSKSSVLALLPKVAVVAWLLGAL